MMVPGITEDELWSTLLLGEHPALHEYDPVAHMSKERAGEMWGVDPKTAFNRLCKMADAGKLKKLNVRSPKSNKLMTVFVMVEPKQD